MNIKPLFTFLSIISLSACSGLTQMQGNISKFDQAAHSVSTTQMNFFHQVQTAECNQIFYDEAFSYANAQQDKNGKFPAIKLNLMPSCEPQTLTDNQLMIRQTLLNSITLYADTIQAMATSTDNTSLGNNTQTLAGNINKFAAQQNISSVTTKDTAALNAAVITITDMILDHRKFRDIKTAASAIQTSLATVVNELKSENTADTEGLKSNAEQLVDEYRTAVSSARDAKGAASFLDIVFSRSSLQATVITPPDVTALNKALDSLVSANQALATAGNGGATAEISDLVNRANEANTLFKAVNQ